MTVHRTNMDVPQDPHYNYQKRTLSISYRDIRTLLAEIDGVDDRLSAVSHKCVATNFTALQEGSLIDNMIMGISQCKY
jgi:hypothetical protein